MVKLKELTEYLDKRLDNAAIPGDASNNGLQVEGATEVTKALFSVDASLELFEQAIAVQADFIFVHHGMSWGGSPKRFTGSVANRLASLFKNDISLYASHLPLDAHEEIGHNAILADMINVSEKQKFCEYSGTEIGISGNVESTTAAEITAVFEQNLSCSARIYGDPQKTIRSVGIISGGGGNDGLLCAEENQLDCYITGEFFHSMCHPAKESGIPVVVLGHYKSETPGVLAVMREINQKFDVECLFADIPTGL